MQVNSLGGASWCFTAIFDNPKVHLWHKLFLGFSSSQISPDTPWLLLGDFNCVIMLDETISLCSDITTKYDNFHDWVNVHGLLDLGFARCKYTWSRGCSIATIRAVHLDRGLCNAAWYILFSQASIKHLERATFDHCPLLLTLSDSQRSTNGGPFCFQAAWLKYLGPSHGSVSDRLRSLGGSLSS